MSLSLHTIAPKPNTRPRRRRIGRGNGSRGTTGGRGTKGQRSRTGGRRGMIRRSLRSLMERVAKQRGFTSLNSKYVGINVGQLEQAFTANEVVSAESLHRKNILTNQTSSIKILGSGALSKALTIRADAVSVSARQAIEKAGGKVIILGRPKVESSKNKEG